MSSEVEHIVQAIPDNRPAKIRLTVTGGNQIQISGTFREDDAPYFYVVFPPDTIPDGIDTGASHPVFINQEEGTVMLNTAIEEIRGDRTLYLKAQNLVDPASLREYFRINTSIDITLAHFSSGPESSLPRNKLSGKTLDLSGSGALAIFNDEPVHKNDLTIELRLTEKKTLVNCVGHIVRKKRLRRKNWQVSLHFDNISNKSRDAIITYLLSEQRRQLRERVHVWD